MGQKTGYCRGCTKLQKREGIFFAYEDSSFDLLLLDIEMEGINGMELAHKLRAGGDNIPIVFVTGFAEYMDEGYDVEALHYLLKPLDTDRFNRVLDRYADKKTVDNDSLIVETADMNMHILQSDIMYAEAFGRGSVIPVSRRIYGEVGRAFAEYYTRNGDV